MRGFFHSQVYVPVVLLGGFVWSKTEDFEWGLLAAFVFFCVLSPIQAILDHLDETS